MLTFKEVYDSLPTDGWLSENEAQLLYYSAGARTGPILEVGCYMGRSTCLLAAFGRTLVCVDPFDGFHDKLSGDDIEYRWKKNTERFPNVILNRCKIEHWCTTAEFGFAYFDGDHTYEGTIAQLKSITLPKCFAVHDYNDDGGGAEVKRACLDVVGPPVLRVERLAVWLL